MRHVVILGDGAWGTALALVALRAGHRVTIWSAFAEHAAEFAAKGENTRFLPGIPIPPQVTWTAESSAISEADVAIVAVPSRYYREILSQVASHVRPGICVVSATKGLDPSSRRRLTEVAEEVLPRPRLAVLSGPSFADEVARGLPTAVVVASGDRAVATDIQRLLSGRTFRVYTSEDIIGVELGGALKNIIAIAAGICDGLALGQNAKAALATRGLAEMRRLGCGLGAHPETFAGLSGMGDLMLTCHGRASRNRQLGERIGRGEHLDEILAGMIQVAEGVTTCRTALERARELGIQVPITEAVHAVLFERRAPLEAVEALMLRELRSEVG